MIQFKIPANGATMKTGGGGEVFMNPQRDIAYAFNGYVIRTFEMVTDPGTPLFKWFTEQGGTDMDLVPVAAFFRKFMEITAGKPEIVSLAEAAQEAGYNDLTTLSKCVVGHIFMNVVVSAYFHGYREATTKATDISIGLTLPKPETWWRKLLKKSLLWLYYKVD